MPSHRQVRPPKPEPIRDAVFEGELVDIVTGEKIVGATIAAEPRVPGAAEVWGSAEVGISEEDGTFRIALPAGRYSADVYYADFHISLDDFTVGPHETVRREIGIDPAVLPPEKELFPVCPEAAKGFVASPADTEALIAAVLERFVRDPSTIGSGREFQAGETVYVDTEIRGRPQVTASALPTASRYTFVLKTRQQLRALADMRGIPFNYIGFVFADIAGDCASVMAEVMEASPRGSESVHLHSCSMSVLYERRDGRWQFKIDSMGSCE